MKLSLRCLFLQALVCISFSSAQSYYISPDGDDSNPGTINRPFASIERARNAVRACRPLTENVDIFLRGGTYRLSETVHFPSEDTGSNDYRITYQAYKDELPVVSGGREITGFKKGDDDIWTAHLDDVAKGNWWFRQLYVDGVRQERGRYPQIGFMKISGISTDNRTLKFDVSLPDFDMAGRDVEVVAIQNWSISRSLISSSNSSELTSKTPIGWVGHRQCIPRVGVNVFLEHSLAFVKMPGQWYLSGKTGTLHYKAGPGENPNEKKFVAPALTKLIAIRGKAYEPVHNLHFKGIAFEHTAFNLPEIGYNGIQACYHGTTVAEEATFAVDVAIEMNYCDDCSIEKSTLQRIGGSGIGIGAGCRNNSILGCLIRDIGATGVNVGHMPVKEPLWADWQNPRDIPVGNEVASCYIHHCGQDLWGAHGIFDAMTRDTHLHHNEVAYIPYGGIATGFIWALDRTSQQNCVIEYNHVHDVMLKLNDSGCIYTLGFQPGSIIRRNLLHGVRFGGFAAGQICNNGIFFDDSSKGFLVEGNVIYDIDQKEGARNTPIRFNSSSKDWQIWIDNVFVVDPQAPKEDELLRQEVGPEPKYRDWSE